MGDLAESGDVVTHFLENGSEKLGAFFDFAVVGVGAVASRHVLDGSDSGVTATYNGVTNARRWGILLSVGA